MIFGKFKAKKVENYNICSPIKGSVIDITKTNDPLFKEEACLVGKKVFITPFTGDTKVFSSAIIPTPFPNASSLKSCEGNKTITDTIIEIHK